MVGPCARRHQHFRPANSGENLQHALVSSFGITYAGAPKTLYLTMRYLDRIVRFLDNNGGDLKVLGEAFLPHVKNIAGALMNFDPVDPGQLLGHIARGRRDHVARDDPPKMSGRGL